MPPRTARRPEVTFGGVLDPCACFLRIRAWGEPRDSPILMKRKETPVQLACIDPQHNNELMMT